MRKCCVYPTKTAHFTKKNKRNRNVTYAQPHTSPASFVSITKTLCYQPGARGTLDKTLRQISKNVCTTARAREMPRCQLSWRIKERYQLNGPQQKPTPQQEANWQELETKTPHGTDWWHMIEFGYDYPISRVGCTPYRATSPVTEHRSWCLLAAPTTVTGEDEEESLWSLLSVNAAGQPITTLRWSILLPQHQRWRNGRVVPFMCTGDDEFHTTSNTRMIIATLRAGCRRHTLLG